MIDVLELRERGREWSLREDVVEKDYMLGWLLWGIASEPSTSALVASAISSGQPGEDEAMHYKGRA